MAEESREKIAEEEKIREKTDKEGNKWTKVYFGGGAHFKNWLSQTEEIYRKENVEIEEIDSTGFKCFEEGGEKVYRIWVRENAKSEELMSE
ncbi:MAG: hypothetical protein U9R04_02595 [Chloroflexota bacterium]|nr:hypothetical protein [Chloroflexota bacterium]